MKKSKKIEKTIRVTQKDIKEGLKECPFLCPIALAASRVFKKGEVTVGGNSLLFNLSETSPVISVSLPE